MSSRFKEYVNKPLPRGDGLEWFQFGREERHTVKVYAYTLCEQRVRGGVSKWTVAVPGETSLQRLSAVALTTSQRLSAWLAKHDYPTQTRVSALQLLALVADGTVTREIFDRRVVDADGATRFSNVNVATFATDTPIYVDLILINPRKNDAVQGASHRQEPEGATQGV